jgi:transcriptional regulator with PAS, ATPase and Fis domain
MVAKIISIDSYGLLFSKSSKMLRLKAIIDQIAPTDIAVLIRGESGTGKELVARAICSKSLRRDKPFVKAFTGAHAKKPGKFELANSGTIFMDEISEIDISLQSKLLQVLQDGEFSRLGGKGNVNVDARVISATKTDLEEAMEDGCFRKDLYYRLNAKNRSGGRHGGRLFP